MSKSKLLRHSLQSFLGVADPGFSRQLPTQKGAAACYLTKISRKIQQNWADRSGMRPLNQPLYGNKYFHAVQVN